MRHPLKRHGAKEQPTLRYMGSETLGLVNPALRVKRIPVTKPDHEVARAPVPRLADRPAR
jgi:hypothetical protein